MRQLYHLYLLHNHNITTIGTQPTPTQTIFHSVQYILVFQEVTRESSEVSEGLNEMFLKGWTEMFLKDWTTKVSQAVKRNDS